MSNRSRPLYYLVSCAGIPNFGDELIAETWLSYLARVAPEADVVLDCLNPEAVVANLSTAHPRVRLTSTLWQLCIRNWQEGAEATVGVNAAVADPSLAGDLADGLEPLRQADVVHLLGGGFLNGMWPPFLSLLSGITTATRQSGGTAAMSGHGMCPPAPEGPERILELVSAFDIVDVRDLPSSRLLGDADTYSCDDVFLDVQHPFRAERALPEVMVSVQSLLSGITGEQLVEFVAKTIAEWNVTEVGLLECMPGEDDAVLDAAERALPVVARFSLADVLHNGFPAAAGQTWISSRFHPHLYAAAAGASGVAINISGEYYGTKHRSLVDQGSRWEVLDSLATVPERPSAGGFSAADINSLRTAKLQVAKHIYR